MNKDKVQVLKRPRITEKAQKNSENSVYVFEILKNANKNAVVASIKEIYGVSPVKVNVVNIPQKSVFVRGKRGFKSGLRKAYVYLKKGDKIEI